jgi:hypothetical protein
MKNTKLRRPFEEFSALDGYDDEWKSIKIAPLNTEKNPPIVKLEWIDDGSGHTEWLTFHGCRNTCHRMDFDVVAGNFLAPAQQASASADTEKRKKFVNGQRRHWRTGYKPALPKDSPVRSKLAALGSFALFKINLPAGTIEVLAKRFTLSNQR